MTDTVSPLQPSEQRQIEDLPGIQLPTSRWRSSQITFGPLGRIVMTLLLFVPAWWFWETSTFSWPALLIWVFVAMPWGLRTVWAKARLHRD